MIEGLVDFGYIPEGHTFQFGSVYGIKINRGANSHREQETTRECNAVMLHNKHFTAFHNEAKCRDLGINLDDLRLAKDKLIKEGRSKLSTKGYIHSSTLISQLLNEYADTELDDTTADCMQAPNSFDFKQLLDADEPCIQSITLEEAFGSLSLLANSMQCYIPKSDSNMSKLAKMRADNERMEMITYIVHRMDKICKEFKENKERRGR